MSIRQVVRSLSAATRSQSFLVSLGLGVIALSAVAVANTKTPKSLPDPVASSSIVADQGKQVAVFAGGWFGGVEGVFEHVKGVTNVVSGFSGGSSATASYDKVSGGDTGHAEAVEVTYDPKQVSYGQLLKIFFAVAHDPTQRDRQGPDWGKQYRSAIFFVNSDQKKVAESYIKELNQKKVFSNPIVTEVSALNAFYPAEEYHQNFITRNPIYPYVVIHDLPKLEALKKQFPYLYRTN
jgi:peptide-methionine (S)-S-oxide reductase